MFSSGGRRRFTVRVTKRYYLSYLLFTRYIIFRLLSFNRLKFFDKLDISYFFFSIYISHVYVKYPYNLMKIGVADRNIVAKIYFRYLLTFLILDLLSLTNRVLMHCSFGILNKIKIS